MSFNVDKIRAGDFAKSNTGCIGLVIQRPDNGALFIIFKNYWGDIRPSYEYRRLTHIGHHHFVPDYWGVSWELADPIFPKETVELSVREVAEKIGVDPDQLKIVDK